MQKLIFRLVLQLLTFFLFFRNPSKGIIASRHSSGEYMRYIGESLADLLTSKDDLLSFWRTFQTLLRF